MTRAFFPSTDALPSAAHVREEVSSEQLSAWWKRVRRSRALHLFEGFALNGHTPASVLSGIYSHPLTSDPVRALVLLNAACPVRLLDQGAVSASVSQRHAAAQNRSTSPARLRALCTDVYESVAESAALNPSTPTPALLVDRLLTSTSLRCVVVAQLCARPDGADALEDYLVRSGLPVTRGQLPFEFLIRYLPE